MTSKHLQTTANTILSELFDIISKIPGDKIITLASSDSEIFEIEINKNQSIGCSLAHKAQFFSKLHRALDIGAGMIIREVLSLKTKQKMPTGKELWIPEKNIYGVFLGNQTWIGLSAEEVAQSYGAESQTGKSISCEENLHYKDFPSV